MFRGILTPHDLFSHTLVHKKYKGDRYRPVLIPEPEFISNIFLPLSEVVNIRVIEEEFDMLLISHSFQDPGVLRSDSVKFLVRLMSSKNVYVKTLASWVSRPLYTGINPDGIYTYLSNKAKRLSPEGASVLRSDVVGTQVKRYVNFLTRLGKV